MVRGPRKSNRPHCVHIYQISPGRVKQNLYPVTIRQSGVHVMIAGRFFMRPGACLPTMAPILRSAKRHARPISLTSPFESYHARLLQSLANDALARTFTTPETYVIPLGPKNVVTHFLFIIADIPMQLDQRLSLGPLRCFDASVNRSTAFASGRPEPAFTLIHHCSVAWLPSPNSSLPQSHRCSEAWYQSIMSVARPKCLRRSLRIQGHIAQKDPSSA